MTARLFDPHGLGSFGTGVSFRAESWWDPDLEQAVADNNLYLTIENGSITFAGQSVTTSLGVALSTQGAVTFAGQTVTPSLGIPVSNGAITVAGQSFTFSTGVALANGSVTFAGQSVTPALNVAVANGSVTFAGQSFTFSSGVDLGAGQATLDGQSVTLALGGNLTLDIDVAGAVTFAGELVALDLSAVAPTEDQPSGGWLFLNQYELERNRRERARRFRRILEDETEQIENDTDREIAKLFREQEKKDARREELERLKSIVAAHKDASLKSYSERVAAVYARAALASNLRALAALDRELERAREEEETLLSVVWDLLH